MRCYNGCPDEELQKFLDEIEKKTKEVKKINPDAHCTYHHPTVGNPPYGWVVHSWGNPISSYFPTQLGALTDAINKLSKGEN